MYGIGNLGGGLWEDTDHDGKTSGNKPEQLGWRLLKIDKSAANH